MKKKSTESVQHLKLLCSHIRSGGDDVHHACLFCMTRLWHTRHSTPSWVQCPSCRDVTHEKCFSRYVAMHDDSKFACPNCKSEFECEDYEIEFDRWNADEAIENILAQTDVSFVSKRRSKHRSKRARRTPKTTRQLRSSGDAAISYRSIDNF